MAETLGTDPGTGISGNNTTIAGSVSGPIGMVQQVNVPGVEAGDIDVSTMNTGQYMQFIASKIDPRTIELQLLYQKSNMLALLAKVAAANEVWTITLPDGSTYSQAGHIKSLGFMSPQNDKISQSATLRMSGPPTFNTSSGS